jgi:chain length determinant protein tyrosine kinase EpsG
MMGETAAQVGVQPALQGPVVRADITEVAELGPTSTPGRDKPLWNDGRLGEILARNRQLTPQQVERIAAVARVRRVRFGDAAVALGLASAHDVFQALAAQFRYACAAQAPGRDRAEQVMLHRPRSAQAEAVRALRSELSRQVFRDGEPAASLAVVSPQAQDGKSFLSANLALAWSQAGRRTLLVDADLRGPRQHQIFGMDGGAGLSSLLSGRAGTEVIARVQDVPGLYVLPAGPLPPNPLELVDGPVFRDLMGELSSRFDQIVVDTPAGAYGADAGAIADRCAATLVVARRDASRLASLAALTARLSQGPARLAGVVMNTF